jgi:hypothetical protein
MKTKIFFGSVILYCMYVINEKNKEICELKKIISQKDKDIKEIEKMLDVVV